MAFLLLNGPSCLVVIVKSILFKNLLYMTFLTSDELDAYLDRIRSMENCEVFGCWSENAKKRFRGGKP